MKKLKITKRYILIILISVICGTVLSVLWYNNLEKAAAPEERLNILAFTRDIAENQVLTHDVIKTSVKKISVPVSLKPANALVDIEELYDKTLVENVRNGEYVVADMLTERGQTTFEAGDYWQVSIDVSEITNFLGLQLKRGDEYQIFFRNKIQDSFTLEREWGLITDQVYIVDLVDTLGNKVFEQREENIKSVILAMPEKSAYEKIISLKEDVFFEIGKAPDNYREQLVLKEAPINQEIFIQEIMREKREGRMMQWKNNN
ncbi:MAG: SAF domain-containing protein [Clostridia bacterium]|nr:SAF domain-containing protein [Clostridia bacterium]